MTPQEYYRSTGPTERAGPPDWYTPTTLTALKMCPLRWQLERSQWGDLSRHPGIPNRKRVAGSIVHDLLEAMFRQLGRYGRPPLKTPAFRAAMRALKVTEVLSGLIAKADQRWRAHPRTGGSPLALDPGDLRNRAFRMFRQSYKPAAGAPTGAPASGALGAEVAIEDEELRLRGRIDLARPTELVEFKTGSFKDVHERQLELYALMWFRQRGVNPKLTLIYPEDSRSWRLSQARLEALQAELLEQVSHFDGVLAEEAPAQPGEHCRHCSVRAFCKTYWTEPRPGDLEFVVAQRPSANAIGDDSVLVGLHAAHVACIGTVEVGDTVRLLGVRADGAEVALRPWGEIFMVEEAGSGIP